MVRAVASITPPIKLLLFLASILLATAVLAVIGFGSVKNEEWIAEKNYESAKQNLKIAVIERTKQEIENIVKEVSKDTAVFVFKEGILFSPKISEEKNEIYLLKNEDAKELKAFLDLQKNGQFEEARKYALNKVLQFIKNPSIYKIDWDTYFLQKMLNDVLSQEDLSKEERDEFWLLLNTVKRLLENLNIYAQHSDFLLALGNYFTYSKEEYSFVENEGNIFLAIASSGEVIVKMLDYDFYMNRINKAITDASKEWSYIPYQITGDFPFGQWDLQFSDNLTSLKKETRKRITLLYLMLIFSLIIPVIGVVVVYRGFNRERQLRLMKDNFLSTISHELKTPLTSVKLYSDLMMKRPEKSAHYTGIILKETNRLESLIDAILNYTRMEKGNKVLRLEEIDLPQCVEKICDSLKIIAGSKGLELKRDIEGDCKIIGDYASIYSLIQNLIDNAIKYTNEGYIHVELKQNVLSVSDTGRGIAQDEQKNIFEGFYRIGDESTRETKGSGLGLAIVKRAADAHKASITLKSTPGKGSTFTVVFKES